MESKNNLNQFNDISLMTLDSSTKQLKKEIISNFKDLGIILENPIDRDNKSILMAEEIFLKVFPNAEAIHYERI